MAIYSWLVLRRRQLNLISQKSRDMSQIISNKPSWEARQGFDEIFASTGTQLRRMSLVGCLAGAEPSTADLEQLRRGVEWNGRIPKIERYLHIFFVHVFHFIS